MTAFTESPVFLLFNPNNQGGRELTATLYESGECLCGVA
jgi:hypothetical protein